MTTFSAKQLEFIAFCIEMYAEAHHLSGQTVVNRFKKADLLSHLTMHYRELHSQGKEWLLRHLDDLLASQEAPAS